MTLEKLKQIPEGMRVVCYGAQQGFYVTHGRHIQSVGTFFKVGFSKIDGKQYAFWKTDDGFKKIAVEFAVRQLKFG